MDRKHFVLVVMVLFLSLAHQALAANAKRHLQTSGILTGYCTFPPGPPGAYIGALGDLSMAFGGGFGCGDAPAPPASTPAIPIPMPSDAVLTNLAATGLLDQGSSAVTLVVNGQPTALSCTLSVVNPSTTGGLPRGACSDQKNSVSVHAGDLVAVYLSVTADFGVYQLSVSLDRKSLEQRDRANGSDDEP